MPTNEIPYSEDNFEQVYLIGIRLCPEMREQHQVYALVLYNEVSREDRNRPLTVDRRIAFFRDPKIANRLLGLGDPAFRKYRPFRDAVRYVYDLPAVIAAIAEGVRDEQGIIADFINELLDFVEATRLEMPGSYRESLNRLADKTTFDRDFGSLYSSKPEDRIATCNALFWSIGAILSSAVLYE